MACCEVARERDAVERFLLSPPAGIVDNGGVTPEQWNDFAARNTKLALRIAWAFCGPRIDTDVTVHMRHLLKAPFCVHPSTGLISLPISSLFLESFVPTAEKAVPSLAALIEKNEEWAREAMQRGIHAVRSVVVAATE